nr:hypothetical protein Iba_chr06cCG10730 [Ipomoea batatas]
MFIIFNISPFCFVTLQEREIAGGGGSRWRLAAVCDAVDDGAVGNDDGLSLSPALASTNALLIGREDQLQVKKQRGGGPWIEKLLRLLLFVGSSSSPEVVVAMTGEREERESAAEEKRDRRRRSGVDGALAAVLRRSGTTERVGNDDGLSLSPTLASTNARIAWRSELVARRYGGVLLLFDGSRGGFTRERDVGPAAVGAVGDGAASWRFGQLRQLDRRRRRSPATLCHCATVAAHRKGRPAAGQEAEGRRSMDREASAFATLRRIFFVAGGGGGDDKERGRSVNQPLKVAASRQRFGGVLSIAENR